MTSALPHLPDYPPPFEYALPFQPDMVRRALWAIEGGLCGEVEWEASFTNQTESILIASVAAYGKDLGRRKAKHRERAAKSRADKSPTGTQRSLWEAP